MENELIDFYRQHPWSTAGDVSRALGLDRPNVKRDSKKLAQRGLLQYRVNGQAYEWAVANGGGQAALPGLMAHPTIETEPAPVNGAPVNVADDQPIRLEPSRALVPAGGMVIHQLADTPASGGRGRPSHPSPAARFPSGAAGSENALALAHPTGVAAVMPGMFEASGDDGSWLVSAWTQRAANEATARADRLEGENQKLRQQVAVVEKPPELSRLELAISGVGLLLQTAAVLSKPALPAPVKAKSLLQEAREKRAAELAEAEVTRQEQFRESVKRQMRQYPPEQWPQLYDHLDPEDWPPEYEVTRQEQFRESVKRQMRQYPPEQWPQLYDHLDPEDWPPEYQDEDETMEGEDFDDTDDVAPAAPATAPTPAPARKSIREVIRTEVEAAIAPPKPKAKATAKPNGNAAPAATEDAPPAGMSMGVKWCLAGLALAAGVAAVIRFPLR